MAREIVTGFEFYYPKRGESPALVELKVEKAIDHAAEVLEVRHADKHQAKHLAREFVRQQGHQGARILLEELSQRVGNRGRARS